MQPDPAIDEVREVRRKISAEFGHDPRRLMAHYAEFEKQLRSGGKYRFAEASAPTAKQAMLNDKPRKD
ncbi:MAG: hypothetical protein HY301_11830 [Verrucomicrobia bacterium]|nr:hypothetical protein [Verrucomicrobiota bacterium]